MLFRSLANSLSFGYFAVGDTLKLDLLEDVQEWSNEVELYLRNHRDLGLSYSSRFVNNAPFPQGAVSLSAEIIIAWRKDWETAVRRRCDNLSALIAELQQRRGAI